MVPNGFEPISMVKNLAFVGDYDKRLGMFYDIFDLRCSIGRKRMRKRLRIRRRMIKMGVLVKDTNVRARRV